MLVLTRREQEKIIITTPQGERIEIVLVELWERKARIGIQAPTDMAITREGAPNDPK